MGTPRKINAILLNIKLNRPKLVNVCRYELTTSWQNFTEIYLTWVKLSQKVLGGLLFLTHTVCICDVAIPYVDKIKYLGVSLSASRTLDVDVSFMQRRFYSSYNSIIRLLFGLQDTNSVICNYQKHYGYCGYPVVTFENLVTNNRSVFCVSQFSLNFRGCSNTQNTPLVMALECM